MFGHSFAVGSLRRRGLHDSLLARLLRSLVKTVIIFVPKQLLALGSYPLLKEVLDLKLVRGLVFIASCTACFAL